MKYLPGTERDAINFAGYSQKYGCIAVTAIIVLAVPCIGMLRHYRVDKEQNKGTVLWIWRYKVLRFGLGFLCTINGDTGCL